MFCSEKDILGFNQSSGDAITTRISDHEERISFNVGLYPQVEEYAENLAAIREPVHSRDHILQLLGGLGVEYNSIVASLTAREDEVSLHTTHSILLTYEQRLNLQNSTKDNVISANLTTMSSYHHKIEGIPIEIS